MALLLIRQVYATYHWTRICQQITDIIFSNFYVMSPTLKTFSEHLLIYALEPALSEYDLLICGTVSDATLPHFASRSPVAEYTRSYTAYMIKNRSIKLD